MNKIKDRVIVLSVKVCCYLNKERNNERSELISFNLIATLNETTFLLNIEMFEYLLYVEERT